jgi:uncharacterized membrane protein YqjE
MKENTLTEYGISLFSMAKEHAKLLSLESELAQISLFPLLISGLSLALFMATLWIMGLIIIGYGLYVLYSDLRICLAAVLIVNLAAIFISYVLIQRYKNRMRFKHTRARLKEILE